MRTSTPDARCRSKRRLPEYHYRESHDTGEPDAVKAARPVRKGADGKVLRATGVTRRLPTVHTIYEFQRRVGTKGAFTDAWS